MIDRYDTQSLSDLWSASAHWTGCLRVELALLEALEAAGRVPVGTRRAFDGVKVRPERIAELERTTRHDVVAFCRSITEQVSEASGRFFHFGVTSSDITDTALILRVQESVLQVEASLAGVLRALDQKIQLTRTTLALGRSHGMAAEPMIFAQKFLSFREEFKRRLGDYSRVRTNELRGQLSGAVGNHTLLDPAIEKDALGRLGLAPEPVSTQVLPRDRIASVVSIGALTANAIERIAVELRHLSRSEVGEVSEGFQKGQTGSSTMPHKKNPVASENLSGLARVIRSHEGIAHENCTLWHERDISHSSAERLYLPDHFGLLIYCLNRLAQTLNDLEVHAERIETSVKKDPRVFSSLVLHELLERNAASRDSLYALVQEAAFASEGLQGFLSEIAQRCDGAGFTFDPEAVSFDRMKAHWQKQFEAVLERCSGGAP